MSQIKLLSYFLFLPLSLSLYGCADVELSSKPSPPPISVSSKDKFCIADPAKQFSTMKIMFVVDISGSNQSTDPSGKRRSHSIKKFVENLEALQGRRPQYGLIAFASKAYALINEGGDITKPRFIKSAQAIYQAAKAIQKEPSGGGTVYKTALQMVQLAIDDDIQRFPEQRAHYAIFFVSDGAPSDSFKKSHILNVINTGNRNIYLSTAYYGNIGRRAQDILKKMATWGNGNYINFEKGHSWDLNRLLVRSDVIPWSLKEFLVYNLNAGFCLDGEIDVDSDVDGMCDRDEETLNHLYAKELKAEGNTFDPSNRFSFGDGYGDFFHWLRYPGTKLIPCMNRSDQDFDLLTACEEGEIQNYNNNALFKKANPLYFDTDKDGLLDGIETFVYFASPNTGRSTRYTAPLDSENLEDNPDGEESVLTQIQQHRNPWFKDPHAEAYNTKLTPLNSKKGDCYEFHQSVLPLYKTLPVKEENTLKGLGHGEGENSILIYYIQIPQKEPDSHGVLQHSVQKIPFGPLSQGLKVSKGQFRQYIAPKE